MKRPFHSPAILRCCLFLLAGLQIASIMVALERPALAYIDPGSGFVFLQVAGSMFAGAVYYLRHRVKRMFGSMRRSTSTVSPAGAPVEVAENQP